MNKNERDDQKNDSSTNHNSNLEEEKISTPETSKTNNSTKSNSTDKQNEKTKQPTYEEIERKKAQKIHANNLIEEAHEIIESCIKCGMCKSLCPVFKVLREEKYSPRGHSILLQERLINETMYQCNLCRACEEKCPLDLKICDAILKAREAMVLKNRGLESNEEMIKNIIETGNPFGEIKDEKDGKLYCC